MLINSGLIDVLDDYALVGLMIQANLATAAGYRLARYRVGLMRTIESTTMPDEADADPGLE